MHSGNQAFPNTSFWEKTDNESFCFTYYIIVFEMAILFHSILRKSRKIYEDVEETEFLTWDFIKEIMLRREFKYQDFFEVWKTKSKNFSEYFYFLIFTKHNKRNISQLFQNW